MKYTLNGVCRLSILIPFVMLIIACYFFIDLWVAEIVHQNPQWFNTHLLKSLTLLGIWQVDLIIFIIIYALSRAFKVNQNIRVAIFQVLLTLAVSNFIVMVVKIVLGRARPIFWFEQHLYGFYGPTLKSGFWSFPSGHTVTIMAIMWSFSLLNTRYTIIWLLLGLLLIATRILLLQHYLSDVLTSIYLAMIVAIGIQQYRHRWKVWV